MNKTKQSSKYRKHLYILFVDIEGYTSLMEADEVAAGDILRKFQSVLKDMVPLQNGEIVNFYGDGALSVFQEPKDALVASIKVARNFLTDPKVPARLGLHSGQVTFEGDKVYGHSVNLASRIESLGIPGSILLSKNMAYELARFPEYSFKSMGSFEFKNINEAKEVFALDLDGFIVPDREQLQGKLKQKVQFRIPTWVMGLIAVLAITAVFLTNQLLNPNAIPTEILEGRIAVSPYENNTGDPALDGLGNMAADWITRNLINIENIKVVQYDNVKSNVHLMATTPSSFAKKTGARFMIQGKYYIEDGTLIFESKIVNPQSQEVDFAFPSFRGEGAKYSETINGLSQLIAGYFAFEQSDIYSFSLAPKYDAFEAYEQGNNYYAVDNDKAIEYFEKAIEIDSSFLSAYILLGGIYMYKGQWSVADSIYHSAKVRFPSLPRLERHSLDVAMAMVKGDIEKEFESMRDWFKIDPNPFGVNYQFARVARRYNSPRSTIEACSFIDTSQLDFRTPVQRWWVDVYCDALTTLKRYDEAIKISQLVPSKKNRNFYLLQKIFTEQLLNEKIVDLVTEMENNGVPEDQILTLMSYASMDYGIMGEKALQMEWANRVTLRILNAPESSSINYPKLAQSYYLAGKYELAIAEYKNLLNQIPNSALYLGRLGIIYAVLQDSLTAMSYFEKLGKAEKEYSFGKYKYYQAQIQAALNHHQEATNLLRQAFAEGYGFGNRVYQYDYNLRNLYNYPPFQSFVKPDI